MSTPRPSDLCGLHTKKAEVLSIIATQAGHVALVPTTNSSDAAITCLFENFVSGI
jgi:hypothetical protein